MSSSKDQDRTSLARIRRAEEVADMREGRRRRAAKFRSAKDYRRRPKHSKGGRRWSNDGQG